MATSVRRLPRNAQRLGLTDRVHFVGAVAGAAKVWLLQNARFTVIPSRTWEAFPLVVLESFAAGKPVIGTMIPGLSDLVEAERTGLLVPPESPQALAEALAYLLQNADVTREYGRHARQIVQEFDWTKIARQHLDLYARLCGKSSNEKLPASPIPRRISTCRHRDRAVPRALVTPG